MDAIPQTCWTLLPQSGFLLSPDPIEDLTKVTQPLDRAVVEELLALARTIPTRIDTGTIRADLLAMGQFDMTPIAQVTDFRITERLFQIYSHFANAFVWCDQDSPSDYIPPSVAVPLVQLSKMVEHPAIKALLGLTHAEGGLSEHLTIMKDYMPKPHQAVLDGIAPKAIRDFVIRADDPNLRDLYNLCLERVVDFRSLHLKMAHAFIAQKVKDPRGTGGTEFMKWLTILRDETAQQLITA